MRAQSFHEAQLVLRQLHWLQECILLGIGWKHQGTDIELIFNYVWGNAGQIRKDIENERIVVLKCGIVQEFQLRNALNDAILVEPTAINWGLSEIARVEIRNNSSLLDDYESSVIPLSHLVIHWEGDRRIDVVFSTLDVERK